MASSFNINSWVSVLKHLPRLTFSNKIKTYGVKKLPCLIILNEIKGFSLKTNMVLVFRIFIFLLSNGYKS